MAREAFPDGRYSREPSAEAGLFDPGLPVRINVGREDLGSGLTTPPPGSTVLWSSWPRRADPDRHSFEDRIDLVARRDRMFAYESMVAFKVCAYFDLTLVALAIRNVRHPLRWEADYMMMINHRPGTTTWEAFFHPGAREASIFRHSRPNASMQPAVQVAACLTWPVHAADRPGSALSHADLLATLWTWQAGRCAICSIPATDLDHDHDSGLVRGWLCGLCNKRGQHASHYAGAWADYERHNPAALLGIATVWRDIGQRGFRIPRPREGSIPIPALT
jgi:Recombination endonuclease VII